MRPSEIRDLELQTLRETVRELEEELFKLRLQNVTHQLDNPIMVRKVRKDVARCKTILREKEMAQEEVARDKEGAGRG